MRIRYDFWSLIDALYAGLTHGSAKAEDRAKSIADGIANLPPVARAAKERRLDEAVEFLLVIREEVNSRKKPAAQEAITDTVTFNLPVPEKSPQGSSQAEQKSSSAR
jgi:hypothetical protein